LNNLALIIISIAATCSDAYALTVIVLIAIVEEILTEAMFEVTCILIGPVSNGLFA
jgi:hypothetical protein